MVPHKEENGIQERNEWVLSFFILYCTVFIHLYCSNFYREQIVTCYRYNFLKEVKIK